MDNGGAAVPPPGVPLVPEAAVPVPSLAAVEVRKNAASTVWYDARLHDLIGGRALVSFEGGVWPDREVPCSSVRGRPAGPRTSSAASSAPAPPQELHTGSLVEVRVAASSQNPPGWALGRLLAMGTPCCSIALEGRRERQGSAGGGEGEEGLAVPAEALRSASGEPPLSPADFARRVVPVEPELSEWVSTPNGQGCLEQIRLVAGLALASTGKTEGGASIDGILGVSSRKAKGAAGAADGGGEHQQHVVFVGSDAGVRRGAMLLQIHTMHQCTIEAFHRRRERRLAAAREEEAGRAPLQASFEVPPALIGRTLGQGNRRVAQVEEACGVEVRVAKGAGGDPDAPLTLFIFGDDARRAAEAREELEVVSAQYDVRGGDGDGRAAWFINEERGEPARAVQEISRQAGLAHIRWTGTALELRGQRRALEDARMLLDHHGEYFGVFQEIRRQDDQIQRSFDALEAAEEAAGIGPQGLQRSRSAASKRGGGRGRGNAKIKEGAGDSEDAEEGPGADQDGEATELRRGRGRGRQNPGSSGIEERHPRKWRGRAN